MLLKKKNILVSSCHDQNFNFFFCIFEPTLYISYIFIRNKSATKWLKFWKGCSSFKQNLNATLNVKGKSMKLGLLDQGKMLLVTSTWEVVKLEKYFVR